MRILYLPIFEGGSVHETAVKHKRGLYDALVRAGHQVYEYDYLYGARNDRDDMYQELKFLVGNYQPDLMLTQLHGADPMWPSMLAYLRAQRPEMIAVNWSGDSWLHSLTAQPMLDLLRHVDLQLVAAPDVLPVYAEHGIKAAYWNIGYEPPVVPLPDMPTYDVVYLGNVINEKRRAMMEMLRTLPYKVGIYGDWEHADGRNVYNFAEGEALYKNATLAIADNVYQDQHNYISNRPMQIMAAGGAMCLHQHVDKMTELSGWSNVYHYAEWSDLDDLQRKISYWMRAPEGERRARVEAAQKQVLECHTYDARVRVLFNEYLVGITG